MKKVILSFCIILALLAISNSAFAGYIKLFAQRSTLEKTKHVEIKHKVFVAYEEYFQSYWMKRWFTVNDSNKICPDDNLNITHYYSKNKPFAVIKKIRVNTYKKKHGGKWKKITQKTYNIKKKWRKAGMNFTIKVRYSSILSDGQMYDEEWYRRAGYGIGGGYAFKYKLMSKNVNCDDLY